MSIAGDWKTLIRLADWIYHAGPNYRGHYPPIDRDTLRRIATDLDTLRIANDSLTTQLEEANRCWQGSLEVQGGLEAQLEESRQYAQGLRIECEKLRAVCLAANNWLHQANNEGVLALNQTLIIQLRDAFRDDAEKELQPKPKCNCDCPNCQWCSGKSSIKQTFRPNIGD